MRDIGPSSSDRCDGIAERAQHVDGRLALSADDWLCGKCESKAHAQRQGCGFATHAPAGCPATARQSPRVSARRPRSARPARSAIEPARYPAEKPATPALPRQSLSKERRAGRHDPTGPASRKASAGDPATPGWKKEEGRTDAKSRWRPMRQRSASCQDQNHSQPQAKLQPQAQGKAAASSQPQAKPPASQPQANHNRKPSRKPKPQPVSAPAVKPTERPVQENLHKSPRSQTCKSWRPNPSIPNRRTKLLRPGHGRKARAKFKACRAGFCRGKACRQTTRAGFARGKACRQTTRRFLPRQKPADKQPAPVSAEAKPVDKQPATQPAVEPVAAKPAPVGPQQCRRGLEWSLGRAPGSAANWRPALLEPPARRRYRPSRLPVRRRIAIGTSRRQQPAVSGV